MMFRLFVGSGIALWLVGYGFAVWLCIKPQVTCATEHALAEVPAQAEEECCPCCPCR